jgi:hypothetical protein
MAAAAVNMSPRKGSSSDEFSSNGSLSRLGEPRAKKLWSLAERVRTDARFHGGFATQFHPNGSTPGNCLQKNRM